MVPIVVLGVPDLVEARHACNHLRSQRIRLACKGYLVHAGVRERSIEKLEWSTALAERHLVVEGIRPRAEPCSDASPDIERTTIRYVGPSGILIGSVRLFDVIDEVVTHIREEDDWTIGRGIAPGPANHIGIVEYQVDIGVGDVPANVRERIHVNHSRHAVNDLRDLNNDVRPRVPTEAAAAVVTHPPWKTALEVTIAIGVSGTHQLCAVVAARIQLPEWNP